MGFRIRNVDPLYTQPETIRTEFTYNFCVSALWEFVMGDQTLADVVAGIFTGVTTALETVKKNLNAAWDGIKSAGQFVTLTVMRTILGSISLLSNLLLTGLFSVADLFTPLSVDISAPVPALVIGSQTYSFGIEFANDALSLYIGNLRLSIDGIFSPSEITAETLGVNTAGFWSLAILSEIAGFFPLVIMKRLLVNPPTVKEGIIAMSLNIVTNLLTLPMAYDILIRDADLANQDERDEIAEVLAYYSYYHYIMMLVMFGLLLDLFFPGPKSKMWLVVLFILIWSTLGIADNYFGAFFTLIAGKSVVLNENTLGWLKIFALFVGGIKGFLIQGISSEGVSLTSIKNTLKENTEKAKSGVEKASSYKTVQNLKGASKGLKDASDAIALISIAESKIPDTETIQDLNSALTMYIFLAVQSLILSVIFAKLAGGYI